MAIKANLVIDQGTDYETSVNITDDNGDAVDLSLYTGAGQLRKHYSSSNSHAFTVATDASGTVTLTMDADTTGAITPGRYVYDVELTSDANVVSRIVEGVVTVTPQVTR